MIFGVEERERVRAWILARARRDARIVAGAVVGSEAGERVDRFSDLDLTFGVMGGVRLQDVLDDWTRELRDAFRAVHLFDLPFLSSVYRVFLFPGNLQVDVSLTPEGEFGALGPDFHLLFGQAVERSRPAKASAHEIFGLGVHHVVRARFCIERGKTWQAVHWIDHARDQALTLACRRHGLETAHARGFDRLPAALLVKAEVALVRSLERAELLRALVAAIDVLLEEAEEVRATADEIGPGLRALAAQGTI